MESFRIGQRIIDTTENARGTIKYLGKFNDHSCHTIILNKGHFKNTNFQSLQTPLIKKKFQQYYSGVPNKRVVLINVLDGQRLNI